MLRNSSHVKAASEAKVTFLQECDFWEPKHAPVAGPTHMHILTALGPFPNFKTNHTCVSVYIFLIFALF